MMMMMMKCDDEDDDDDVDDHENDGDDVDHDIKCLYNFSTQSVKLEPPVIAILAVMPPLASPVSAMALNIHVIVPLDSQELTVMVSLNGALNSACIKMQC